jgi:hypothetical protein
MAWETRNGRGRYYTRSRRVNGRIVRQYVGKGAKGEQAAAADARHRDQEMAMDQALQDDRRKWQQADGPLEALDELDSLLMEATLYAAGFHRHSGGEWRRIASRRTKATRKRAVRKSRKAHGR